MINEFDDFFVSPLNQTSESIVDDISKYMMLVSELPKKIKEDSNFDSGAFFSEISTSKALFRKNPTASNTLSLYWLSQIREKATILSIKEPIASFNFTRENLSKLKELSLEPENIKMVQGILKSHGILLIYLESLPGMKVDGVTFVLDSGVPVIGMTLRYDRLDNYWFTLLHELSHVILHYDKLNSPLFDDLDQEQTDDIEMEANGLALNTIIPRYKWRSCNLHYEPTVDNVLKLAYELKIHPSIVAGRYRKETKKYSQFSDIVNSVSTRDILL